MIIIIIRKNLKIIIFTNCGTLTYWFGQLKYCRFCSEKKFLVFFKVKLKFFRILFCCFRLSGCVWFTGISWWVNRKSRAGWTRPSRWTRSSFSTQYFWTRENRFNIWPGKKSSVLKPIFWSSELFVILYSGQNWIYFLKLSVISKYFVQRSKHAEHSNYFILLNDKIISIAKVPWGF